MTTQDMKQLPIEQQVCTLEQAKKLKDLGIETQSFFSYYEVAFPKHEDDFPQTGKAICLALTTSDRPWPLWIDNEDALNHWLEGSIDFYDYGDYEHSRVEIDGLIAPAYTSAELGVLLPERINKPYIPYFLRIRKGGTHETFSIAYKGAQDLGYATPIFDQSNEASLRATMLIHLLENNLIRKDVVK